MPDFKNILSAVGKMLVGKRVPVAVYDARIALCQKCDRLELENFCGECGCLVIEKADLANEECPIKKWGKYLLQNSGNSF